VRKSVIMREPANRDDRATEKHVHIPTVLAVGCSDVLLARCWDCLAGLGVMVRDCDPARAATLAAARRPLLIVVARDVNDLDAVELEALARDVHAALLPVDEDLDDSALAAALVTAVRRSPRRAENRRSSGRYSILPGELVALPSPVSSSEPPPTSAVRPAALHLDTGEIDALAGAR
jgi:hypothetical protein